MLFVKDELMASAVFGIVSTEGRLQDQTAKIDVIDDDAIRMIFVTRWAGSVSACKHMPISICLGKATFKRRWLGVATACAGQTLVLL